MQVLINKVIIIFLRAGYVNKNYKDWRQIRTVPYQIKKILHHTVAISYTSNLSANIR